MQEPAPHIRPYQPEDLEAIHNVVTEAAKVDEVDPYSTLENIPTAEELQSLLENSSDVLVAVDGEQETVVGYGAIRWWQEDDGTFVYLHQGAVTPEHRRKGIGSHLVSQLQERIQRIAAEHPADAPKVYGANAAETEVDSANLLQKHGYEKVWSAVEMEFTGLDDLKELPTPKDCELRDVVDEADTRAVYRANKEVYDGNFGSSPVSEEDYQELLHDNPDTSLWKVLWHDDKIAGFVLSKVNDASAEIMEVSVMPEFRGRGIGKYLMVESMLALRERGVGGIRLHTDAEGKRGGRQLYESLGFTSLKQHHRYRKSF